MGGMGEVYRATDTHLKRSVAIKVLPDAVSTDPERLARFQREAEVLASLNHPNIAQIYGLEKSPTIGSALVMELVEGPTLAERIAATPMPVDEVLAIARQIAESLEVAHEQGIVHRDLKPANVKVREDGTVKVLDFGLAKALEPASAPRSMSPSSITLSPTIATPAMTQVGFILGSAAYMSPEQARGRTVDQRVDIWAFGCVLYEMLTGKRAFDADEISINGGILPQWREDGKELFFVSAGNDSMMMAVDVNTGATFTAGIPRPLFKATSGQNLNTGYAVRGDGQMFLMPGRDTQAETWLITVVVNWSAELE
jgi:serine/threonine protein kinase